MFYNDYMQSDFNNFQLLTSQADFDLEDEFTSSTNPPCLTTKSPVSTVPDIFWAKKSGGGSTPLLKTLLTSACEKDCYYCPFRAGRDFRRATLKPYEMAKIFSQMAAAGLVQGLFLSSGVIGGGVRTQDKLIDTAEILRTKYDFRGYLHLKLMPGADKEQVRRSLQLASRVSVNLEAPNQQRLERLAPHKSFLDELVQLLQWANEIRQNLIFDKGQRKPSLVTQLVVGAAGETDTEILKTSAYLYNHLQLSRIYYSRFSPIPNTPLENLTPENPLRPLRLYQASFLIRDYGFSPSDFEFDQTGNLPLQQDPKTQWAQNHLIYQPVEVNKADYNLLLRIPGIGPKTARKIIDFRRKNKINSEADLKILGIPLDKVSSYILVNGKMINQQLSLW
ncbi:MAG: helix-hairpin-helix domain-containing protein [Chloroflexota bacterium]